jgi:hypothetical protein
MMKALGNPIFCRQIDPYLFGNKYLACKTISTVQGSRRKYFSEALYALLLQRLYQVAKRVFTPLTPS